MALKTQKGLDLPSGAVALSEKEALEHQWTFIKNWPSETDVLFIKFGRHIVAGSTFFSSMYIMNFLRKTLNVNKFRFFLTLTPGVLMPTIGSYMATNSFVTNSILLMKLSCPLCDQLKFGGVQLYLSLVFPALYGYFSLSTFAIFTKSYPLPSIYSDARAFWKVSFNIFKTATPRFQVVGLVQTILILFLPYLQSKQLNNVMIKFEQRSSEELSSDLKTVL